MKAAGSGTAHVHQTQPKEEEREPQTHPVLAQN